MSWAPPCFCAIIGTTPGVALAILWIEAVCTGADGRTHYEITAPDLSEEEKIALVDLPRQSRSLPALATSARGRGPHPRRGHADQRHQRAGFGLHPRRRLL